MEFEGAEASGLRPSVLEDLVREGHQVVAADVRGMGETRTPHKTPADSDGGAFRHVFDSENALTYLAWYLDRSLFGMRVQDVLRTVDSTTNLLSGCSRGKTYPGERSPEYWQPSPLYKRHIPYWCWLAAYWLLPCYHRRALHQSQS